MFGLSGLFGPALAAAANKVLKLAYPRCILDRIKAGAGADGGVVTASL